MVLNFFNRRTWVFWWLVIRIKLFYFLIHLSLNIYIFNGCLYWIFFDYDFWNFLVFLRHFIKLRIFLLLINGWIDGIMWTIFSFCFIKINYRLLTILGFGNTFINSAIYIYWPIFCGWMVIIVLNLFLNLVFCWYCKWLRKFLRLHKIWIYL